MDQASLYDKQLSQAQLRRRLDSLEQERFAPDEFRRLLKSCSEGQLVYVCRQIADDPDFSLETRIGMVKILLDEHGDSLQYEVGQIAEKMTDVGFGLLGAQLLEGDNLCGWKIAIAQIIQREHTTFVPLLIHLWDVREAFVYQEVIMDALSALHTPSCENFLTDVLRESDDSRVISRVLNEYMKFRHGGKHKIFGAFLDHADPKVRFAAVQGLNRFGRRRQRRKLFQALTVETDYFVLEILMKTFMARPDVHFAHFLLRTAISHENSKVRELANLHYRQLRDELIFNTCTELMEAEDEADKLFAITELSFLELPPVPALLQAIVSDVEAGEALRGAAIEGLSNHRSAEVEEFLWQTFQDSPDDPYLTYLVIMTMTKLWGEEDRHRVAAVLRLEEDRYAGEIQAVLAFLEKKLRAKKMSLDEDLVAALEGLLQTESTNILLLTLRIFRQAGQGVDLDTLLALLAKELPQEGLAVLQALLARQIGRDPAPFFAWLDDPRRTDTVILHALGVLTCVDDDPETAARLCLALIAWPGGRTSRDRRAAEGALMHLTRTSATRVEIQTVLGQAKRGQRGQPLLIKAALLHLTREAEVRAEVSRQLAESEDDLTLGLLFHADAFTPAHFEEITGDYLFQRVLALPEESASLRRLAIRTVSRFDTRVARERLMDIFLSRPELKPQIAESLNVVLVEV